MHFHSVWQTLILVAWPCTVNCGQSSTNLPSTFKRHLLSNALYTLKTVIYPHAFVHAPGRTLSFSHSLHHTDIQQPSHSHFKLHSFVHLITLTISFSHLSIHSQLLSVHPFTLSHCQSFVVPPILRKFPV